MRAGHEASRAVGALVMIMGGLMITAAGGCEKKPQPAPPTPAAPAPGSGLSMQMGDMAGGASAAAKDALAAFQKESAQQLDAQRSQLESLKATAKAKADEQLDKWIAQIEDKLAAAKGKLQQIKSAEGGAAAGLQKEATALMAEAKKLYDQAMQRVAELN